MHQGQLRYRLISFVLTIFCPFNVLSQNETISLSPDHLQVAVKDKAFSELPQCTFIEIQQINRKYELCHQQKIKKIEQQFNKRVQKR